MRRMLIAAACLVMVVFGYSFASGHHIGAPPLPYGPCPSTSTLTYTWFPGNKYPHGAEGTEYYLGWTEVAACSGVLKISVGG